MGFWGWVFLATTVLVALKHEKIIGKQRDKKISSHLLDSFLLLNILSIPSVRDDLSIINGGAGGNEEWAVIKTYRQLWHILWLAPVRKLCFILLTVKLAFAVTDGATNLKLIEYVSK